MEGAPTSKRFILTGTWPNLGGGNSLELGKDKLKTMIKDSRGSVTKAISCLTNALVVGDNPGLKTVQEAHEQNITILDINQLKDLIYGIHTLEDLLQGAYLAAGCCSAKEQYSSAALIHITRPSSAGLQRHCRGHDPRSRS